MLSLINNCNLNVTRNGEGPSLLFLHGIEGSGECATVTTELAKHHEVILPDHPGFGLSDSPEQITSVSDLAYFYLDLLDTLNVDRVDLVGHCLGGWIAAEMAVRNTTRIRSLTLVASAGLKVKGVAMGDPFLWSPDETARQLLVNEKIIAARLAEPLTEAGVDTALKNQRSAARYAWSPRFHNPDLGKWLHRLDIPTLILWGDKDRLFPPAYAERFSTLIPNAAVTIFEQCGHLPMIEKPQEFVTRLCEFLDELPQ
jgi:pimeloyl-ACP methyl ester carboxylesterase